MASADQPGLGTYIALAITWLLILTTALHRFPKFRLIFSEAIMFVVRRLALTFGWIFVSAVYVPIHLFNYYSPFVPYDSSKDEKPKAKATNHDLSKYKVSDYDFTQRFPPVFKEDDDDDTGGSESEWVKVGG
jgi:hypothetical protein